MIKSLLTNKATNLIVIVLMIFGLVLLFSVNNTSQHLAAQRMGTYLLHRWKFDAAVVPILQIVFLILNTMLCSLLVARFQLIKPYSFLASVFYLVAMYFLGSPMTYVWVLLLQSLILILFFILLAKLDNVSSLTMYFYSGVVIGFMSMVFPPLLLLFITFIISANSSNTVSFRTIFLHFFGILLPYIYFFSWMYLSDQLPTIMSSLPTVKFTYKNISFINIVQVVMIVIFGLMYMTRFNRFTREFTWHDQQKRISLLICTIGILVAIFLSFKFEDGYMMLLAPSLGIMMGDYYGGNGTGRWSFLFLIIFVILSFTLKNIAQYI